MYVNKLSYLKLNTIHKCFLYPYKMQVSMLCLITLRGVRAHKKSGTFTTQIKRYISGSKPCSRTIVTIVKQTNHAKPCGYSTQAHRCIRNTGILVVCVIYPFPIARFTCIVTSQVFVKN